MGEPGVVRGPDLGFGTTIREVSKVPEKDKAKLPKDNEKIIGLVDPSFRYLSDQGANTGFGLDIFDTTTHGDRAIYQLHNTSGGSRVLGDHAIYGKPVLQIAGQGGFLWEYSDFDDIDVNGEMFVEISNKLIIDPLQCEAIGDWAWKRYAPHKAYSFVIPGAHPEIEPGSVWSLPINHSVAGVVVEAIDCDIEIKSVSLSRTIGDIGATEITGVVYDGAWSKTNTTRARMVGGGRPQWMQNRSNTLVVASADYVGSADYYCDGTADDVEIQDAIDKLVELGGGVIQLTQGVYRLAANVTGGDYVGIYGAGNNTIIKPADNTITKFFDLSAVAGAYVRNLLIDGDDASITFVTGEIRCIDLADTCMARDVTTANFTINSGTGTTRIYAIYGGTADNCIMRDCTATNGAGTGAYIYGLRASVASSNCLFISNTATNDLSGMVGFIYCNNVTNGYCASNTVDSYRYYGFWLCTNVVACISKSNTGTGTATALYSFNDCTNVSACTAQSNSVSGVSGSTYSFISCLRVVACNSLDNTGLTNEHGFSSCKSVQQCKSSGDTTAYYLSYADSGTSNACADTAAGGYNS